MNMSNAPLSPLVVKVLNKLSLTKSDIFPVTVKDAKDDLDAVTYINIKGYMDTEDGEETLSISVYDNGNISCEIYNKTDKVSRKTPAKGFVSLVNSLKQYATSSVDDLS